MHCNSSQREYTLIIQNYINNNSERISYSVNKSLWNYTRGIVINKTDNLIVCDIKRNFPVFPFLFFEKKDKEYLICGKSYNKQCVIDLSNGIIYEGFETDNFCWSRLYKLNENTLLVNGKYYNENYIYKFFDFTNPENGWKEIEMDNKILENNYNHDLSTIFLKINTQKDIITFINRERYINL